MRRLVGTIDLQRVFRAAARADLAEELAARPVTRSPAQEARDEWLHWECHRGIAYRLIIARLAKRPDWDAIETVQGVKDAATAYA
jgi:hypothetical protein